VGHLDLGPGNDDETGRQAALAEPLPVPEQTLWHIKGTKAERVIQEARNAASDYLRRESEGWESLRQALEDACDLEELEGDVIGQASKPDVFHSQPHLLPGLKRWLHDAFFDRTFLVEPPPPKGLDWQLALEIPGLLRLQGEPAGIGSPEDHQRIKKGVTAFLAAAFYEHRKRFSDLDRLRQDMMLMEGIVEKTLEAITEDEIRRGICPACPYPEATLEQITASNGRTRRAKQE